MLVAGCSMLVEDIVFSGDKEKAFLIPSPLRMRLPLRYSKYPETGIQRLNTICTTIF